MFCIESRGIILLEDCAAAPPDPARPQRPRAWKHGSVANFFYEGRFILAELVHDWYVEKGEAWQIVECTQCHAVFYLKCDLDKVLVKQNVKKQKTKRPGDA